MEKMFEGAEENDLSFKTMDEMVVRELSNFSKKPNIQIIHYRHIGIMVFVQSVDIKGIHYLS